MEDILAGTSRESPEDSTQALTQTHRGDLELQFGALL